MRNNYSQNFNILSFYDDFGFEDDKRNFDLPRSMISYVLFDVILKIGEYGLTEPIGKLLRLHS